MNAPLTPVSFVRGNHSSLAARLRKELDAEVMFDAASRGRYSTDASIYQVEPIGVVVPRSEEAARAAIAIAVENGVPILRAARAARNAARRSVRPSSSTTRST